MIGCCISAPLWVSTIWPDVHRLKLLITVVTTTKGVSGFLYLSHLFLLSLFFR
jgi:hypothetical protein